MKVTLHTGIKRNGEYIKELEMPEIITVGMEEDAFDMCLRIGKGNNLLSAEICTLAVLTGSNYDEIRNLPVYDISILREKYHFLLQAPKKEPIQEPVETQPLMPEQV